MKTLKTISTILLLFTTIVSCKRENILSDDDMYVKGWTRVIGVKDTDTSTTIFMNGKTETVGLLLVEDNMLRAELMSFSPLPGNQGQYVIRMTNKQSCRTILRWSWEGLNLNSGNPSNDEMNGNEVVTFTFIGDAVPGRIKVKAEKLNGECSNSSTLVLEITNSILPIEFTSSEVERKGKDMYVTFSTDSPQGVDWFFVMWSPDGNKANETIKAYIASDHVTKKYKLSYPAVKKENLK